MPKKLLSLLFLMAAMLLAVSCKSQYYFPGSNGKKRKPAKGCNCPTYMSNETLLQDSSLFREAWTEECLADTPMLRPEEGNESGFLALNPGL